MHGELPSEAEIERYRYLDPALDSLYVEIKELSKKKPDGIVAIYKIALLNKTLSEIKEILKGDPALAHIDLFSVEELPQYSDVVMVLGQFKAAMDRFKNNFYGYDKQHGQRWFTQENPRYEDDEEEVEEDDDNEGNEPH